MPLLLVISTWVVVLFCEAHVQATRQHMRRFAKRARGEDGDGGVVEAGA